MNHTHRLPSHLNQNVAHLFALINRFEIVEIALTTTIFKRQTFCHVDVERVALQRLRTGASLAGRHANFLLFRYCQTHRLFICFYRRTKSSKINQADSIEKYNEITCFSSKKNQLSTWYF